MERGKYVILESGEGLGKDYHAELLVDWLESEGHSVVLTKEPGGTPEAEQIRKILLDKDNNLDSMTELFLYEAARRDLNQKVVLPAVNSGQIVVCKRGFPSTYAYQGFAGGMNLDLIDNMNKLAMQETMPNLILIIDGDPAIGLVREVDSDRFATKGLEYHNKVREGYLDLVKRYSDIATIVKYQDGNPKAMQEEMRSIIVQRFGLYVNSQQDTI